LSTHQTIGKKSFKELAHSGKTVLKDSGVLTFLEPVMAGFVHIAVVLAAKLLKHLVRTKTFNAKLNIRTSKLLKQGAIISTKQTYLI
jgi:hypothetical protein